MHNIQLCIALDVEEKGKFETIINKTIEFADFYKIGPVALSSIGLYSVEYVAQMTKQIFIDLKFFDIPSVVRRAIQNFSKFGCRIFTVHILAGEHIFKTAVETAKSCSAEIAGVTILTSHDADKNAVLELAEKACKWGADWIVSHPKFSIIIKDKLGDIRIISPGIRIDKSESEGEEHRDSFTPQKAIEHKVDMIVVGRPIVYSQRPDLTAKEIKSLLLR